ncbi:MAG: hypothetical protein IJV05_05530 [Muribaculaceae bacterium]|nr:hypothetical protein [Muribaculaceae bacterium]
MNRLLHIAALLSLVAIILMSCSDDGCTDNGSSLPLAAFYVGSTQQSVNGLKIKGIGAPGDSLLVNSSAVKEAYLPLRASVTSTSYALSRFHISGQDTTIVRDTLTISYEPVAYFHSEECGAMFNFYLNSVISSTHGIDSVIVLTTLVTNSRTPSMRIYFTDFQQ